MNNVKTCEVLEMIATEMVNDTKYFDGQPFNGKTVAMYFGHQGAAIAKLADIVKLILAEQDHESN